jgi:hypothetical protein
MDHETITARRFDGVTKELGFDRLDVKTSQSRRPGNDRRITRSYVRDSTIPILYEHLAITWNGSLKEGFVARPLIGATRLGWHDHEVRGENILRESVTETVSAMRSSHHLIRAAGMTEVRNELSDLSNRVRSAAISSGPRFLEKLSPVRRAVEGYAQRLGDIR